MMRDENKLVRQAEIEAAAYAVLEEKGFGGTSMLAIARKARASNETLYNWYGDKLGLFRVLVARNADEVMTLLRDRIAAQSDPVETLTLLGPMLLEVVLSPRAVALTRAAAADASGELGRALSAAGREVVAPLIGAVLEHARRERKLSFVSTEATVALYLDLLVGDLQLGRVIGRLPALDAEARAARAAQAQFRLALLCARQGAVCPADR
jgi:AcrR family transcriptional regulator